MDKKALLEDYNKKGEVPRRPGKVLQRTIGRVFNGRILPQKDLHSKIGNRKEPSKALQKTDCITSAN